MATASNTLIKVDGVTMPCPSAYEYQLMDVSAAQSGRTQAGLMLKNRVCQKRKILLTWTELTLDEISTVMQAFNPEYFSVTYTDFLDGQVETRTFYVGDRTAPVRIWTSDLKRIETLSFDIIER